MTLGPVRDLPEGSRAPCVLGMCWVLCWVFMGSHLGCAGVLGVLGGLTAYGAAPARGVCSGAPSTPAQPLRPINTVTPEKGPTAVSSHETPKLRACCVAVGCEDSKCDAPEDLADDWSAHKSLRIAALRKDVAGLYKRGRGAVARVLLQQIADEITESPDANPTREGGSGG